MTMDELRRQIENTKWPVTLRVDGKDIEVRARDDLLVPTAGNLICVFQNGAFEIIDANHIATLRRDKSSRKQMT